MQNRLKVMRMSDNNKVIGDRCWYCGGKLCWDNDFDYADVFGEGEGIALPIFTA